jgi:dolichyl-diphosphooligosaccharide--protein glycosyltransferase
VTKRGAAWGLAAACVLAVAIRSLGWGSVFIDGDVLMFAWDGSYHARRALYSFVEFPRILFSDPYLRFPDGAPVPMPPLYDWLLAAVARGFGSDVAVFERVAAWWSPALSALALLPTFALGRALGGRGVGLIAALLLAVLPANAQRALLGNPDHHAAVALLLVMALAASTALLEDASGLGRRRHWELLLLVSRVGMVLTWSGSLLYLAIGEGAFLLASLLSGRSAVLTIQARSAAFSAAAIAPWVWASPTPIGGAFTTTTLSWIHPIALLAVAAVTSGLWWAERVKPSTATGARLLRAGGVVIALCALALSIPALREALAPALEFLTKTDSWGTRNIEQRPMFGWPPGGPDDESMRSFGGWSYMIPLAPFVFLTARSVPLTVRVYLALWSGCLAALSISQLRFASDFAPLAGVAIALGLDQIRRWLAVRAPGWLAWTTVAAVGLGLTAPPVYQHVSRNLKNASWLGQRADDGDPALRSGGPTLFRFAQIVRANTPETSGYFDPNARPEYGILVKPSFGHVFSYAARRATPATGFGPYLDVEKYEAALSFYNATQRASALSILDALETRYVVTRADVRQKPGRFTYLLHVLDGAARKGKQHLGEFRLVVEGPAGGTPLRTAFPKGPPRGPLIPYKLFERVAGAVLEAEAEPGTAVTAELQIQTNTGRRFVYRARATADPHGVVRLRVPYATYATEQPGATRTMGLYRVTIANDVRFVPVLETEVQAGAVVSVAQRGRAG